MKHGVKKTYALEWDEICKSEVVEGGEEGFKHVDNKNFLLKNIKKKKNGINKDLYGDGRQFSDSLGSVVLQGIIARCVSHYPYEKK